MKRGYLFCIFLILILVLPWLTLAKSAVPEAPTPTQATAEDPTEQTEAAPLTPVAVHSLGDYEGEFLEDGSDTPVRCACIVLENTGDKTLEYVRIRVEDMIFEATYLPPKEKALVLEQNGSPFRLIEPLTYICEEFCYLQEDPTSCVYACAAGQMDIIVTNLTERTLCVTVRFKQYSPEAGMYWGGITYSARIDDLPPGESRCISPYRFLTERGRIVHISAQ